MVRDINFRTFKKLLKKKKLRYNILMAFCDELKAYITGFMPSGNTYTSNGAAEMIKEIIANLRDEVDNIVF